MDRGSACQVDAHQRDDNERARVGGADPECNAAAGTSGVFERENHFRDHEGVGRDG